MIYAASSKPQPDQTAEQQIKLPPIHQLALERVEQNDCGSIARSSIVGAIDGRPISDRSPESSGDRSTSAAFATPRRSLRVIPPIPRLKVDLRRIVHQTGLPRLASETPRQASPV